MCDLGRICRIHGNGDGDAGSFFTISLISHDFAGTPQKSTHLIPHGIFQGSSGEIFLIDKQWSIFSSKFSTLKKDITQRITKERLEICNSISGQEEGRSAGYLDVSMMTSKGPSGTPTEDRKGMPGSQGFIHSESRQEILSRDRKHRGIIYG